MDRSLCCTVILPALLLCVGLTSAGQSQDRPMVRTAGGVSSDNTLPEIYKKWLDEDARYIITDQERADFSKLTTDTERDDFVRAFWERRNPTPGAQENKFKEEHYRRIAYTNTHFAAGVPGFKTDRGRIYILYGPPDEIEHHPASSGLNAPQQGLVPERGRHSNEVWRYRIMKGVGQDIFVEFVDTCDCGEYRITVDPTKKHPADGNKILQNKI